ncbi:MAG: hypothetical protein ACWA44_11740 [Thiotrichales bacterium]
MTANAQPSPRRVAPLELLWWSLAVVALLFGLFFYLLARPPGTFYGITGGLAPTLLSKLPFSGQLPTFLHCYAFILLSAAFLGLKTLNAGLHALFWFVLESCFEIAQLPQIASAIDGHWPDSLSHYFLLDNVVPYFLNGQFDWLDLLSLALAGAAAYATLVFSSGYLNRHVQINNH